MADEDAISVPLAWVDSESPVVWANQFLFQQIGPDEFVLNVGQALPPPLLGSEEEQREQASRISFVPVRTLTKFTMTRARVEELIGVLQRVRDRADDVGGEATS